MASEMLLNDCDVHGLIGLTTVVLELLCAQTVRVGVLEYMSLSTSECVQSGTR